MSLIESLGWSLQSMGFAQLALTFAAVFGYAVAINGSLQPTVRWQATLTAIAAATAFCLLAPSWVSGVVLMLFGVLALGALAACTWMLAMLFGLDGNDPATMPGRQRRQQPQAHAIAPSFFRSLEPVTSEDLP